MSMRFIKPTSLNSAQNSIHIDGELSELDAAQIFAFLHPCDLASRA